QAAALVTRRIVAEVSLTKVTCKSAATGAVNVEPCPTRRMPGARPLPGWLLPGRHHHHFPGELAAAHHSAPHRLPLSVRLAPQRHHLRGADRGQYNAGYQWRRYVGRHYRAPQELRPARPAAGDDGAAGRGGDAGGPVPPGPDDHRYEPVFDYLERCCPACGTGELARLVDD